MPPRPILATPTVSATAASNVSRAITDSLVNPKAQQFVAPSVPTSPTPPVSEKKESKKPAKEDPMTCITFTIRTSMLAKLQDFSNQEQAESGELNLSRYLRGIMKRHIDRIEAAQLVNVAEQ